MADTFTKAKRSEVMRRIRGKDTAPELAVRRALHALGWRYRLHVMTLPGRPDIVISRTRTVIQVKGCFWHSHHCLGGRIPPGKYWKEKLPRNRARDRRTSRRLRTLGWRVKTIWECRIRRWSRGELAEHLERILGISP